MIKDGVRSCPLYLMCFTANFAVRVSLRCGSSSCFGLAPLWFPNRLSNPAAPTTLLTLLQGPHRNRTVPRKVRFEGCVAH
jgi:hypothetical protein